MKKQFLSVKKLFPVLLMIIAIHSHSQSNPQYSFELTTSKTNIFSSRALIDVPALTDNPLAIIVASLADNQRRSNPHPIGTWYYQGKWNIFNTDHASMQTGLIFKITYYLKPGADQFVHTVGVIEREGSYINNARLNNNPTAKIDFFQIHGTKTNGLNPYEAEVFYSTLVEKWCIRNKDGSDLTKNASFNIVVYATGSTPETATVVTTIAPTLNPLITAQPLPIPSGWTWDGTNIYNSNSGFVGIGNNNPAYRLDVAGPMLVRSSGATTGSAGIWLNDDYNYKAGLMGMENDNHIGFFGVGINGWKFSMNTNTGALKINGSEGKPGQVLASNAPAAPSYTSIGNVLKTEMKKGTVVVDVNDKIIGHELSEISHTITLTAKSKIIISAQMIVTSPDWSLLNPLFGSQIQLLLKANTSKVFEEDYSCGQINSYPSLHNYIIELDPGTYNLAFYARFIGGLRCLIYPKYSSIIILPMD